MTDPTCPDRFPELIIVGSTADEVADKHFVRSAREVGDYEPFDVYETDEEYVARLFAPDLKPEDLDITIEENVLTVHGLIKQAPSVEGVSYRVEGEFTRFARFLIRIDAEKIQVGLENETLTVSIPKLRPRNQNE